MRPVRDAKWLDTEAYLLLAVTHGSLASQFSGLMPFFKGKKDDGFKVNWMLDVKL